MGNKKKRHELKLARLAGEVIVVDADGHVASALAGTAAAELLATADLGRRKPVAAPTAVEPERWHHHAVLLALRLVGLGDVGRAWLPQDRWRVRLRGFGALTVGATREQAVVYERRWLTARADGWSGDAGRHVDGGIFC